MPGTAHFPRISFIARYATPRATTIHLRIARGRRSPHQRRRSPKRRRRKTEDQEPKHLDQRE